MSELNQHIEAIAAFFVAVLGAIGAFFISKSKAKAKIIEVKGDAHKDHAEAEAQEAYARLTLDEATRQWGIKLIEKFDAENEELRNEIRILRESYRREIDEIRAECERQKIDIEQRYKLRIEQMQAEIDSLRAQNVELLALVRGKKNAGYL